MVKNVITLLKQGFVILLMSLAMPFLILCGMVGEVYEWVKKRKEAK